MGLHFTSLLVCMNKAQGGKRRGARLCSFLATIQVPGSKHADTCSGEEERSLRWGPQPVFLSVRNSLDLGQDCGSQTPEYPDATGNLKKLRSGEGKGSREGEWGRIAGVP